MNKAPSRGTFMTDPRRNDAATELAQIRQGIVDSLHRSIEDEKSSQMFPDLLVEAVMNEIWAYPRQLAYSLAPPMALLEFVTTPYPKGLGTTEDVVKRLIAGNPKAMLAWDQAVRREHGGAHNPHGLGGKAGKTTADIVKLDIIQLDNTPQKSADVEPLYPTGTSADAGLRRLDKAAERGDPKATELLRQVLDKQESVHAACVAMGWRKKTVTVEDAPAALCEAAVRKIGPLEVFLYAWKKASASERLEIKNWIAEQGS